MAAAIHNIQIATGEDFFFTLTVRDGAGEAVDVTSDNFVSQIRRGSGKPLVASFTCSVTDGPAGVVECVLTDVETNKLDGYTSYDWDLFRIQDDGTKTQLIYGEVRVTNKISNV